MKIHKVLFLVMCLAVSFKALSSGENQEMFQKIFGLFSQTAEYNNIVASFEKAYRQPKQTAEEMLKLINNMQLKAVNGIKTVEESLTVRQQAKAALYVLNRINNQILLKKSKTKKASKPSDSETAIGKALAANALQANNKKLTPEAALQKIETGKIVALYSLDGRSKVYYGVQNLVHLQDLVMNDLDYLDVANPYSLIHAGNKLLTEEQFQAVGWDRLYIIPDKTGLGDEAASAQAAPAAAQTIQSVVSPVKLIVKINMILGTAFNEQEIKFTASSCYDLQEQINRMIAMASMMTPDDYQLTFDGKPLDDNVWKKLSNGCMVEMNDFPGKLLDYLYETLQQLNQQAQSA